MGISDRDYYRDDPPTGGDNTVSACTGIIVVTVILFFVQMITRDAPIRGHWLPSHLLDALALDPVKVYAGQIWRLLSHMFIHSETVVYHVVFNMLMLHFVGREVEQRYGNKEFLAIYLCAGLVGALAYLGAQAVGITPPGRAVGASGAVTGMLLLFALHNPYKILMLFGVIPIPAWLLVVISMTMDLVGLAGGSKEPIAFAAHLGGAVFGLAYYQLGISLTGWMPTFRRKATPKRPALRVFQPDPAETPVLVVQPTVPRPEPDEHLEAKLDQVLEKVTRHGQASLSDQERQILFRASEVYKRRRK